MMSPEIDGEDSKALLDKEDGDAKPRKPLLADLDCLQRVACAVVSCSLLYSTALLAMMMQLGGSGQSGSTPALHAAKSMDWVASNPLAIARAATPLLWGGFLVAAIGAAGLIFLLARLRSQLGRRRKVSVVIHVLALFLLLLLLAPTAAALLTSASGCAVGFPKFWQGGFCKCNSWHNRPLLSTEGLPLYGDDGGEVLVAFSGDWGGDTGGDVEVYKLIQAEGASAIVVNGDLDYSTQPTAWRRRLEQHVPGATAFVTVGNHDTVLWRDYQDEVHAHWTSRNVTTCSGEIGVRNLCTHQGIGLLLSGAGSTCGGPAEAHDDFFRDTLQEFTLANVTWPICVFHFQQALLQTGLKSDAVGWAKYQACLDHGALIVNGHEHAYARTHQLDRMSPKPPHVRVSRKVEPGSGKDQAALLGKGQSLVVMAGLGGHNVRGAQADRVDDEWWAATWNTDHIVQGEFMQGFKTDDVAPGAFFCRFRVDGEPDLAHCYFKDVAGHTADDFYVRRRAAAG